MSGPVVTLSAVGGKAIIQDMVRCPQGCASVDIDQFAYRVIQHQMVIKSVFFAYFFANVICG